MKCLFKIAFLISFCLVPAAFAESNDRISPEAGKAKVKQGALLVDVREAEEFNAGHIAGALNVPLEQIETRLAEFGADKSKEIVLYCRSGRRSGLAKSALESHGYKNVFNAGGYEDLKLAQ